MNIVFVFPHHITVLVEITIATQFSTLWGSLHLLHNNITFPAFPVPIYTPGSRGIIMVKCLTDGQNTLALTGLKPTTFCL